MPNYNDPAVEEQWCNERRAEVIGYLQQQAIHHGRVGEWPAWHVAPYVSVWAIESRKSPDWVGWWVICGDLPTDYVSSEGITHPREAVRAIARRWRELLPCMERGEEHPTMSVGSRDKWAELVPLLRSRSELLGSWAEDESMWAESRKGS